MRGRRERRGGKVRRERGGREIERESSASNEEYHAGTQ